MDGYTTGAPVYTAALNETYGNGNGVITNTIKPVTVTYQYVGDVPSDQTETYDNK